MLLLRFTFSLLQVAALRALEPFRGGLYTCRVLQPLLELLKDNMLGAGIPEQASSSVCGTSRVLCLEKLFDATMAALTKETCAAGA